MTPAHTARAAGWPASRPRITPIWAEQGIARASRIVAMTRSRRVSSVRVTIVAIVSQPKPRTIGITARPFRPIFLNTRSISIARRGR